MTEEAHKILCKFIERKTKAPQLDTAWIRKVEMPRGTGKTTVITQAYLLQKICQNPDIAILLANEKADTAIAILSEIKHQIENNELLRSLYPEIVPDDFKDTAWSATRMTVKRTQSRKEPTVTIIGVGGTVTGLHFDLIFVDDMLSKEAMESARAGSTADVVGQLNRWVHQLIPLLSGAPDRAIDFIGTRWFFGDSYEHIEKAFSYGEEPTNIAIKAKLSDGRVQRLQAYRVGDLAVFRRAAIEDGQPAFVSLREDKFGLEALAKERIRDADLFAANMMNNPADELTRTFKEPWLRFYEYLDTEHITYITPAGARKTTDARSLDVLLFVDPGGFKRLKGGDRARGAIIATGTTQDGLHLLLAAHSERENYTAVQKEVLGIVQKFGARKVYIENAGQQISFIDQTRDLLRKNGLTVPVEEVPTGNKAKDDRVLGLEDYFERSLIYVGRSAQFTEFLEQYRTFPKSTRKDLLDALSQGPGRWKKTANTQQRAAQRQAAELASYYAKRGLVA